MALFSKKQQPVLTELPTDLDTRRRVSAWLGLLSDDLERVFVDASGGVPLAPEDAPVVAAASTAELRTVGLPAELVPQRTRLESVAGASLRVGAVSALVCLVANVVVDGLGGMIATIPESLLLYGLVVPAAISFLVAAVGLPTALITGVIGALRRRDGGASRARASANVAALAQRGVQGRAAEVDAKARDLARDTVRARLPSLIETDTLVAIEEARQALRRVETPPEDLVSTIEGELDAMRTALSSAQLRDTAAHDASAPLTKLRQTAQALRQLAP